MDRGDQAEVRLRVASVEQRRKIRQSDPAPAYFFGVSTCFGFRFSRHGMFEFVMHAPVKCPLCHAPVTEKIQTDHPLEDAVRRPQKALSIRGG